MTKAAKLASQARLPDDARPPATPTRFDSAMPTLKKRSGNFLAKISVRVELWTSPSKNDQVGEGFAQLSQGESECFARRFADFHGTHGSITVADKELFQPFVLIRKMQATSNRAGTDQPYLICSTILARIRFTIGMSSRIALRTK